VVVTALFLIALLTASPHAAVAQFDQLLKGATTGQPPPAGVERRGLLESTDVILDGQMLFKIASPAVLDRSKPGNQVPIEDRARQINETLRQLTGKDISRDESIARHYTTVLDPETVQVFTQTMNSQPVLMVRDAHLAEPKVLLTVTDSDAQYHAMDRSALAARWELVLDEAITHALVARLPGNERRQYLTAGKYLGAVVLATMLLGALWRMLERQRKRLNRQVEEQAAAQAEATVAGDADTENAATAEAGSAAQLAAFIREYLGLRQRLQVIVFLRWLLLWLLAFVWAGGLSAGLYQFPETRGYAHTLASTPVIFLIAWFVAGLVNHLGNFGLDQAARVWEANSLAYGAASAARQSLRIRTIVSVVKGLKASVIYIIAVLWILQRLRFVPASLIALGAVVALAVSFAAQSLVKDLVNGFLILVEDQYAIGDTITAGAASGVVENMNLRVTQIRSDDGRLITIPNSLLSQVENHTRLWSRVNLVVRVAYETEVDHALAVVRGVAEEMGVDPEWAPHIVNPKELLGVDAISHEGISVRLWVRTRSGRQGAVARELRRRLKRAFDGSGIRIGIPLSESVPPGRPSALPGVREPRDSKKPADAKGGKDANYDSRA
jgi:small conductance mechanosensitive channel